MGDDYFAIDGDELNRLLRLLLAYAEQQKLDHAKLAFMCNIISVKMGDELGLEVIDVDEIRNVQ